ncbi:gamma carbonic anhydrase family protein [Clostridium swellfunianum]|uniref:gamma carbonic anhydrase family protein n=1 Tax=Clostridium swellfunianum TaxID=1367462 RepID=UPI00202E627B|nr:gamma carbonic anhydrase family protein [Clostridium swellfunianum]MCM0646920.1 gamma carbonic anhydrase family protein [Clostridium swellfunianum]
MLYKYEDKYPKIHSSAFIAPSADVIGDVTIDEDSSVWFGAVIRGDENYIKVGKGTNIQDNCTVHINNSDYATRIGDYVTIGHNAVVHACTIGDYCLIGMGAIVLDGAEVGDYTIIGAGSLVTSGKKIPSGVIAIGSPVKIVRELTNEEKKELEDSAKNYIKFARKFK